MQSAAAGREAVMDEESFRCLYELHARGLWAFLFRMTMDRTLAEDLLQETFYRFLRAGAVYQDHAHAKNSLYRIAANLARDAHRRRRIRLAFTGQVEPPREVADPAPLAGDTRLDVARALAGLSPRDRAILWLAYAEGATHEEIAGAVGVRATSVKSMLSRARVRLAGLLGMRPGKENAK
jgi:RNA polymerase sigma-70 factor (ECF subfamily)